MNAARRDMPLMTNGAAEFFVRACLVAGLSIAALVPARAGTLQDAACQVFGGRTDCRTVRVFDAQECIVKVHPQPLPDLEPEVAACLRDEVRTRKVHLRKASWNLAASDRVGVSGPGVVEVLVEYDDRGAAVWETRNAETFALKSDPARMRQAVATISSDHCAGPSRLVGGGTSGGTMGVKDAFARAAEGSIVLVDIRLPSEWRETGVGANAVPITMHQNINSFVDRLRAASGPDRRPIALICAEGVRSASMQKTLMEYGFRGVIDVHEGMRGGANGPGWIRSGLPLKSAEPAQARATH